MTRIAPGRPVVRETGAYDHADPLIVELHPTHLVLRLKRKPATAIAVSYAQVFRHGAKFPGGRP